MTHSRFEIGCLFLLAVTALATLLFLLAGSLHLWNSLAYLPWLHERMAMSRLTFLAWTSVTWIAAAFVQRVRTRRGAA